MNNIDKVQMLKATAENEEARQAFAASLSLPIGQPVKEESSVREIFAVHELEPGQLPIYPKHFGQVDAIVLPRIGETPQNLIVGDEVTVPTFEVSNSAEWKISFARDGRFDVVQNAIDQVKESIVRIEENEGWEVLKAACSSDNDNVIETSDGTLGKSHLNSIITKMRGYGYNPTTVYLNPDRAADIREWGETELDPNTRREIFVGGGLGNIWNVDIRELRDLGDEEVYLVDTNRVGVMPIRQSLTTYDLTDSAMLRRLRHGFMAWEEIGFMVADSKAIVKLAMNT